MKKLLRKPTVFSVIAIILIVIGIPTGIYGLTQKGGNSLQGYIILTITFYILIGLILDRILIRYLSQKHLTILEIFLFLILMTIYSYRQRTLIIDCQNSNSDFFLLIKNDNLLWTSEIVNSFPFNKKIKVTANHAVIDSEVKSNEITFKFPEKWGGYSATTMKTKNTSYHFYSSLKSSFDQKAMDSIYRNEVNKYLEK